MSEGEFELGFAVRGERVESEEKELLPTPVGQKSAFLLPFSRVK